MARTDKGTLSSLDEGVDNGIVHFDLDGMASGATGKLLLGAIGNQGTFDPSTGLWSGTGTCQLQINGVAIINCAVSWDLKPRPFDSVHHHVTQHIDSFSAQGIASDGTLVVINCLESHDRVDDPNWNDLLVEFNSGLTVPQARKEVKKFTTLALHADDGEGILPAFLVKIFSALGIVADEAIEMVMAAMKKFGANQNAQTAVSLWLQERKMDVSQANVVAKAMLALAEIRSGQPGYHKDHQGLA